jgi:hypothetical protein
MSSALKTKCLVFASAQCADSGEIGDGPFSAVFDSPSQAAECFTDKVAANRRLIETEIATITDPANALTFEAPYLMQVALISVPAQQARSASDAIRWISEQLKNGEELADRVVHFEGVSYDPDDKKQVTLESFWEQWP